jgi:hypothetical protein
MRDSNMVKSKWNMTLCNYFLLTYDLSSEDPSSQLNAQVLCRVSRTDRLDENTDDISGAQSANVYALDYTQDVLCPINSIHEERLVRAQKYLISSLHHGG